jgi:hypothetical protein
VGERTTTINGTVPSSSDVRVDVKLYEGRQVTIVDISAINWKRMVEVGQKRRLDGSIGGTTRGRGSFEASMTLFEEGWAELEAALAEVDPSNISLVQFQVTGLWTPPKQTRLRKVEIKGVRILEDGFQNAEGVDPSTTELKLDPTEIVSYPDARGPGNYLIGGPR